MKKYKSLLPFLIFIILFVIINKTSKIFLNQTNFEKRSVPQFVERVYGKKDKEDYLLVLQEQNFSFKYSPFIEFLETERNGRFVTVSGMGNRCNRNDIEFCVEAQGGKNEIWVFGGSTTFGYGVKNDETIPAYLEKLINRKKKVINFGSGFWFSTQERIFFQNLITKLDPPSVAIFIDGANDFSLRFTENTAYSSIIKDKLDYKKKRNIFVDWLTNRITRLNIYRLAQQLLGDKKEKITDNFPLGSEQDILSAVKRLEMNHKINAEVGLSNGVIILNILQPLPINNNSYKNSNLPEDYSKLPENLYKNFVKAYEVISKSNNFEEGYLENFLDLRSLEIQESMYVDNVHYSPKFNEEIAKEILKKLNF